VLDSELVLEDDADDHPPRLMLPPDADRPWHVMVLRDTNPPIGRGDRTVSLTCQR